MIDWLEQNRTRPYPFVTASAAATVDAALVDLLVCAYPTTRDDEDTLKNGYFKLSEIDFGSLTSPTIKIVAVDPDAVETPLITAATAATVRVNASGEYTTVEWLATDKSVYVHAVVHTASAPAAGVLSPAAMIVPSAVYVSRVNVTELAFDGTIMDPTTPVTIAEGYNCKLDVPPAQVVDGQTHNRIRVSFVPGAGLGRITDCDDPDLVIRSISGVGPDSLGAFRLQDKDCTLVRPIEFGASITDWCTPCCRCEDMVATYQAQRSMMELQKASIHPYLTNARIALSEAVHNFNNISFSEQIQYKRLRSFFRVLCYGGYAFVVQAAVVNGTMATAVSSLSFECEISGGDFEGFLVAKSGGVTSPGSNGGNSWSPLDPSGTWPSYNQSVSVPRRSWRVYQFELVIKPDPERAEGRKDAEVFSCTLSVGGMSVTKTCDVIGLESGA